MHLKKKSVKVDLHDRYLDYGTDSIGIVEITKIKGRKAKQDIITTAYDTVEVDGNGGSEQAYDIINIDEERCSYNDLQVIVRPNTAVNNPSRGSFKYVILPGMGEAKIRLLSDSANDGFKDSHRFFFKYNLNELREIGKEDTTTRFNFNGFNITIFNIMAKRITKDASYMLSDNTALKIGAKNLYAIQQTALPVTDIIKTYPAIANRLKMTIVAQSNNETVVVGHGHHDVLHNDPKQKTHLVGNGGENIFVVTAASVPVVIYDIDKENKIDTLDLRPVAKDLALKVSVKGKDITIANITLKDALVTNWYERLHIITDKVPMKIEGFALKPLPLEFTDQNIIVIGPDDVEKEHKIIVSRPIGDYTFGRSNNDLILTNAFDGDLDHAVSITLKDFYVAPKMQTLLIKFTDKDIAIKDELNTINSAKPFQDQIDAYKIFGFTNQTAQQRVKREAIDTYATGSATKPSSWINRAFHTVQQSFATIRNLVYPASASATTTDPAVSSDPDNASVPTHPVHHLEASLLSNPAVGNDLLGTGELPIRPTTGSTLLEMGDQWIKNSDTNGLLTWGSLLARKWTGYRPKVFQAPSHDPAVDVALSIRSHEWVDAFMDQVQEQAQACGMEEATAAIFESAELYTQAVATVRKKMATGQIEDIAAPLFEQVVQENSSKIAATTTSDQADQLLANVREALPKLEQQFLQPAVSLQNSQEKEQTNTTSKANISLLKQAMCSMQPIDQLADATSTLRITNTMENLFVQNSIENGNPYRKCAGL